MFVGACVYREDHWLVPLLRLRGIVHVGAVSYGIYLLHGLVRNVVVKVAAVAHIDLPAYGTFVFTVIGSVFLRIKHRYAVV